MRGTSSPREKLTGGFADGLGAIAQVRRGLSQRWQLEASRTTRFAFHSEKLAPNFLYSPCRRRSIRLVSLNSGAMFDDERRGGRHGPETHRGPPPKCYTRGSTWCVDGMAHNRQRSERRRKVFARLLSNDTLWPGANSRLEQRSDRGLNRALLRRLRH